MPFFATLSNIILEVLASTVREEKEIKYMQTRKEKAKLFVC